MTCSNFKKGLRKIGAKVAAKSPEILVVVGAVSLVGAVGTAIWGTTKAEEVVEAHEERIATIKKAHDLAEAGEVTFTEQDELGNYIRCYGKTIVGFLKVYLPTIALTGVSLVSFLCGHGILKKRYVGASAALSLVSASFSDYRERITEKFGAEADKFGLYGGELNEVTIVKDDESGKKKKVKELVWSPSASPIDSRASGYAVLFDERSRCWSKDQAFNLQWLNGQASMLSSKLHSDGYLFLIDVYRALDVADYVSPEQLRAAHVVGWIDGEGDDTVDLGIYTDWNRGALDMYPEHQADPLLLDFNVDGVIWDRIG